MADVVDAVPVEPFVDSPVIVECLSPIGTDCHVVGGFWLAADGTVACDARHETFLTCRVPDDMHFPFGPAHLPLVRRGRDVKRIYGTESLWRRMIAT